MEKKISLITTLRTLHRNIGFLVIGLTLVYALSGLTLIFRNTDLLKSKTEIKTTIAPNLTPEALTHALQLRRPDITKTEEAILSFRDGSSVTDGTYDQTTGSVRYTSLQRPAFLERFIRFHKINSNHGAHWLAVIYGTLLLFLALSPLGFFKIGTRPFAQGLALTGLGVAVAAVLLLLM